MEPIKLFYEVDGEDFTAAGAASSDVKRVLKKLGISPKIVQRVAICTYEGEINMVIHADGGTAEVEIGVDYIKIVLADSGPGIPNISRAMEEGYSTANAYVRNLGFGAGMGLPNMKKCSDDMRIETELGVGTRVTMRIAM